jgi:hypothetical protein
VRISVVAMLAALAGCASGQSSHVADLDRRAEEAVQVYEWARDTCDPGQPCEVVVDRLRERARSINNEYRQAVSGYSYQPNTALIQQGQALMQPRPRITCSTSNTSMPVTVCQ